MSPTPIDLDDRFAALGYLADRDAGDERRIAGDADLPWMDTLAEYRDGGVFIVHYAGESEWERHPADEMVLVVDGRTTMTLAIDGARHRVPMTAMQLIVVPADTWHRFDTPRRRPHHDDHPPADRAPSRGPGGAVVAPSDAGRATTVAGMGSNDVPPAPRRRPRRMERSTPVWEPPAEIVELMGDVSGNELNGWGEPDVRQPTVVMWANPARLAHGKVQERMTEEFVARPDLRSVLRLDDRHEPAPLGAVPPPASPEAWVDALQGFASSEAGHRVELFGIARARPEWFFEGRASPLPWIVVLGVGMDHAALATAPEPTSAIEVHRQYNRGTAAARALADWIRARGHQAHGHGGPGAGPVQMIPAAIEAGFGELGKHGSIINRRLGSSFRLAAVLTDAPLVATPQDSFGVDEFCAGCRVCTDDCPPDAISPDKRMVRGVTKWAVDFDRCLPYFALSYGCGICIAVCPWSTPGEAPRLAANMARKQARRLGADEGRNLHSKSRSTDRS